jgi:hypothetical protein
VSFRRARSKLPLICPSLQKCDGYGDKPCCACARARRPVCVYEPFAEEEHTQYLHDLKHGRRRREKLEPPAELQTTRQDRVVLEAMLDVEEPARKSHRRQDPAVSERSHTKERRAVSTVVSEDALDIIDVEVDEEPESKPRRPSHRKKAKSKAKMPRRQFDMEPSHSGSTSSQSDPGDIYVGKVPRRHLAIQAEPFYVEDLPVSVPYPMRYYLDEDSRPIVSWRKPEPEGTRSKWLAGTLYENGNRVNPRQMVDIPTDRRASHACEYCRFK